MLLLSWWLGESLQHWSKALFKTQSQALPVKVLGYPARWSCGDIHHSGTLVMGALQHPWVQSPTGDGRTWDIPALTRGLEALQARVCKTSTLYLLGLTAGAMWDLL